MKKILIFFLLINCSLGLSAFSNPSGKSPQGNGEIKLVATLNKEDWTYKLGEKAIVMVAVLKDNKSLTNDVVINYEYGLDKMGPLKKGTLSGKDKLQIDGGTLKEPGFLRFKINTKIDGKVYQETLTAAFEPENIRPTATVPDDFTEFWKNAISKCRKTELDVKLTSIPKSTTANVNVYQVDYQYAPGQRFYGVLSIPKKEGKYPAIIRFPGAGVRPLGGDIKTAEQGFITLDLNIHGVPVIQKREVYENLQKGRLAGYQFQGITHRDSFYYKNVILGCVRSVDMIYSLPEFNGKSIGAWGSSQGGALSIITTSLEPRINYLVALCPAMSDLTGYLHNRAGGWPHIFNKSTSYTDTKAEVLKTIGYYDVVNFAKNLKVPGFYSWGFNDETTPPTTFYSAYNVIKSPKQVFIIPSGVHKIYPSQREKTYSWLMENIKK